MKIIDKLERLELKSVLEIFVPIFVLEHNWNAEDKYEDLFASKKRYLTKMLVDECNNGSLKGVITEQAIAGC